MTPTTPTPFDQLAALFRDRDHEGFIAKGTSTPMGVAGDRIWSFYLDGVDRVLFSDASDLVEYIGEFIDTPICVLRQKENADAQEMVQEYDILVGNLSDDPSQTWALHIQSSLPNIEDFDAQATVSLLEGPKLVLARIDVEDKEKLERATRDLIVVVNNFTKHNPQKILELFAAVSKSDQGADFMAHLTASIQGEKLQSTTAQAPSRARPSRV